MTSHGPRRTPAQRPRANVREGDGSGPARVEGNPPGGARSGTSEATAAGVELAASAPYLLTPGPRHALFERLHRFGCRCCRGLAPHRLQRLGHRFHLRLKLRDAAAQEAIRLVRGGRAGRAHAQHLGAEVLQHVHQPRLLGGQTRGCGAELFALAQLSVESGERTLEALAGHRVVLHGDTRLELLSLVSQPLRLFGWVEAPQLRLAPDERVEAAAQRRHGGLRALQHLAQHRRTLLQFTEDGVAEGVCLGGGPGGPQLRCRALLCPGGGDGLSLGERGSVLAPCRERARRGRSESEGDEDHPPHVAAQSEAEADQRGNGVHHASGRARRLSPAARGFPLTTLQLRGVPGLPLDAPGLPLDALVLPLALAVAHGASLAGR